MTEARRRNLARLLAPRSIACIGGDDAAIAVEQCRAMGFSGPIWGVNPHRESLGGLPCYASVEALPEAPEAAFLAVPRREAVASVAALARAGTAGVVGFTAGFAELGAAGKALEKELVAAAGEMALVGPNCYGLLNFVRGVALWPFGFGGGRCQRGAAIVSQSGMLCSNLTMNQRSLPLAYLVSAGNQAMLGIEDYLEALVEDPAVSAVGLHIEGLRDAARFTAAAIRALEREIPIVVLKSGSSAVGARLTISHTGSLSGRDEAYQALFERLAIIRVGSPNQFLETLKMAGLAGLPKGRRLIGFTASGGDCTFLADEAERLGLDFPQPAPGTAEAIASHLPEIATVSNPLDYTTPLWGREERLRPLFAEVLADGYDAAVLVQDYPHPEVAFGLEGYRADARAFMASAAAAGVPAAVVSGLSENLDRESRELIVAGGAAPLQGLELAMAALAGTAQAGARRAEIGAAGGPRSLALIDLPPAEGAAETLSERDGKRRLAEAGVPVPAGRLCDAAGAPAAAEALGFPVVAKMTGPALAHKTEAGALRLGLASAAAVAEAVAEIRAAVAARAPAALSETFLVERQIRDPVAELLVGIRREPQFGFVLVLGSGGILTELVADARTLLLPADEASLLRALAGLKASALLSGYRGRPPGDRAALLRVLRQLSAFAEANAAELEELEINPLLVLPEGVTAVDVLLRLRTR